jgi:addiction module HigA family antidote
LKEANIMGMKNPPHPGEMIGDSLEELGVSISEAAKSLGITRQQLHNLIAGRSAITTEMAMRLEKALGSTAEACEANCAKDRRLRAKAWAACILFVALGSGRTAIGKPSGCSVTRAVFDRKQLNRFNDRYLVFS